MMLSCQSSGPRSEHTSLDANGEPLRSAFNQDAGKVRAILIGSPTWGGCLRGFLEVEKGFLEKNPNPRIAVYAVWSTQLGAEEKDVAEATTVIPDRRVRHYWDGELLLGRHYQPILGSGAPAWDVYLLFDRDAVWDAAGPPKPDYWEHQLRSLPEEKLLDAKRFAAKAQELLSQTPVGVH
jgi:hypothetical protein